jgi:hypothetical protein
MDSESEGASVRVVMENLPTLAKLTCPKGERQAPKGEGLKAIHINECMVSTRKGTRRKAYILKPRKIGTRNGGTRQRLSQG